MSDLVPPAVLCWKGINLLQQVIWFWILEWWIRQVTYLSCEIAMQCDFTQIRWLPLFQMWPLRRKFILSRPPRPASYCQARKTGKRVLFPLLFCVYWNWTGAEAELLLPYVSVLIYMLALYKLRTGRAQELFLQHESISNPRVTWPNRIMFSSNCLPTVVKMLIIGSPCT